MNISVCPYSLVPKNSQINSMQNLKEKRGVLLKVKFDNNMLGYSDFHNNESFPEMNLFDLKKYFQKIDGEQWQQSLYLAKLMSEKVDVTNLLKVNSHHLIQDILSFDALDLLKLEIDGFNNFKVKLGKNLRAETVALKNIIEKSAFSTRFRLDFNTSLRKKEFQVWLEKNKNYLLKKIDFIEDPFKFDANLWRYFEGEYKVNFAIDMAADPFSLNEKELPSTIILKPAVQNIEKIVNKFFESKVNFVVTHFMDHPLGQLGASFVAQNLKKKLGIRLLDCGLMGYDFFEKNDFSEIKFLNQSFVPSNVYIKKFWGMDFILKDLKWLIIN